MAAAAPPRSGSAPPTTSRPGPIKGGSGTTDELVLEGGNFQLNSTTGSRITGFEILGINNNVTGPITMSLLSSAFSTIHLASARNDGVQLQLTDVANNTTVALDTGLGNGVTPTSLYLRTAGAAANQVLNFSLGTETTSGGSST